MIISNIITIALILFLTLLSGWGDSQGFVHAAKIWSGNKLIANELYKSFIGFALGIVTYWMILKYLQRFNIVTVEVQTLGWFAVTIIGIAITTGNFTNWARIDQLIAILVFLGVGWLLVRVG